MNKEVYIRVDANDVIATGHVMRCLSIAEQLRKNNVNVTFVTADNNSSDIIRDRKFLVDILNSTWNDFDKEIDIMKEYLIKNQVKLLIVDSYYITANYLNVLSEYTKIIYIDDLKKFEYNVSTVICRFTKMKKPIKKRWIVILILAMLLGMTLFVFRDCILTLWNDVIKTIAQ